jgi:hypothetical protein
MMNLPDLTSVPTDHPAPFTDQLRAAVAACLARFTRDVGREIGRDVRCAGLADQVIGITPRAAAVLAKRRSSWWLRGGRRQFAGCALCSARRASFFSARNLEYLQGPYYAAKKARIEDLYAIADR